MYNKQKIEKMRAETEEKEKREYARLEKEKMKPKGNVIKLILLKTTQAKTRDKRFILASGFTVWKYENKTNYHLSKIRYSIS